MTVPVLALEDVRAGYGRVPVLHDVSLTVAPGSTVALLGANGAGKTTTLKVAAGLLSPTAGSVRLHGRSVERLRPHRRAGICLIPEGRGIFRRLTVRQNVAMQVQGKGVAEAIDVMVRHFPVLGGRLSQIAGTLSGGQQQMLALTRALVTNPLLVMADELSLGLAPVVVDEIFLALEALHRRGVAILVVEQYIDRILGLADTVTVLQMGRVVFKGAPPASRDELFERYVGGGPNDHAAVPFPHGREPPRLPSLSLDHD